MTHPVTELAAAAFIIVAAVGTMFAVSPQPKPEPPPTIVEKVEPASQPQTAQRRVSAEPLPPEVVEQKKVEQIAKDIDATQRDIIEIKEIIRLQQLERAIKNMPNE